MDNGAMDTKQVIDLLRASKRTDVAKATGLKYMWLSRVVWGDIKEPSSQKIDLLRHYFSQASVTPSEDSATH